MTTTLRSRPDASEYAPFYHGYVEAVPEGDIVDLLRSGGQELAEAIGRIPEDRGGFRYGPEKWSIREVLGHLIDAERIFAYRALRVGRGDHTPLASFDENEYVKTAGADARTIADLVRELRAVRETTVMLFASLSDEAWGLRGVASGKDVSLRALAYITAGHARHHLRILRERYAI
jgi:hypothetical protein